VAVVVLGSAGYMVIDEAEDLVGWMDVVKDSAPVQDSELELTGEVSLGAAGGVAVGGGGGGCGCGELLQV
jgi:hypothetical protein